MAFPIINFKFNGLEEAQKLTDVVSSKLEPLDRYIKDRPASCRVEFEKVAPQNNGNVHRVETNLTVDGELYRAEATEESFMAAIDEMRNELDKELRRDKSKKIDNSREAGRQAKDQMLEESGVVMEHKI